MLLYVICLDLSVYIAKSYIEFGFMLASCLRGKKHSPGEKVVNRDMENN